MYMDCLFSLQSDLPIPDRYSFLFWYFFMDYLFLFLFGASGFPFLIKIFIINFCLIINLF